MDPHGGPDLHVPKRSFRIGCASLLTMVGAVLVCCGLVAWQWNGANARGDRPTEAPRPITGSVVLLSDEVSLVYSDPDGGCTDPILNATQSPTQVVLALSETDAALPVCAGGLNVRAPLTLNLASPLGTRALIDHATGRVVPYFDQRLGLRPPDQIEIDSVTYQPEEQVDTNAAYFGGPGASVMVETLTGRLPDGRVLAAVQVIQVSGGGWHPPATTVMTPVTVRGQVGRAAAGIVVWSESGLTVAVAGTGLSPTADPNLRPDPTTGAPLPTAVLVRIAEALKGASS